MTILPRFMFHNLFARPQTSYAITKGTETIPQPLSNAFDYEPTTSALVQTDANGEFEVVIYIDRMVSNYSEVPYGSGYPNGEIPSDVFVFGASRHDLSLQRFAGGVATLTSNDDGNIFPSFNLEGWLVNSSLVFNLGNHNTSSYTIHFGGFSANEFLSIPSLYVGDAQSFGGIAYGYDDYADKPKTKRSESESGVGYSVLKHKKMTAKPYFQTIEKADWEALKELREFIEEMGRFWYQFDASVRDEVYFMRQLGNFVDSKIDRADNRSAHFNLEEVL